MNRPRGWLSGLITTAASLILILGAVLLSTTEGRVPLIPTPIRYPTLPVYDYSFPATPTQISGVTPQEGSSPEGSVRPTATVQAAQCTPPSGWQAYRVLPGDSLASLARAYSTNVTELKTANCLVGDSLAPSSLIYLPPHLPSVTPIFTQTQRTCGAPQGWVAYRIQPDDNLFRLSMALGVSVPELQFANCLGNSTRIVAGSYLMVPFIPVRTATFTLTATPSATFTATMTFTVVPTQPFTQTPSQTALLTATPSITPSPVPSATPTPTPSTAPSSTPSITPSPAPTNTPSATPSVTATSTP